MVHDASPVGVPAALDQDEAQEQQIRLKDLALLGALPFMIAISWLCSDRSCERLARSLVRLLYKIQPRRYAEHGQIFREFLPQPAGPAELDKLVQGTASLLHLERLQLLRYYRPGGWDPCIQLTGQEHLRAALAQGRGAILWVVPSRFSDMATKVALRRNGFMVWHLSRHTHGAFSSTRFGIQVLNPIRLRLEHRYLAERVVIDPQRPKIALNRLAELLAENRVVSIAAGAQAKRVTMVRLGGSSLPLAGGAPSLAIRTGAPLLPVFTERRPDNSILVTIAAPLGAPITGDREEQVTQMLHRFAVMLESHFLRLPEQFECLGLYRTKRRLERMATCQAPPAGH